MNNTSKSKNDGTSNATVENRNVLGITKNYVESFNKHAMKSWLTPFGNLGMHDSFATPFDNMLKHVTEYNQDLMSTFAKQWGNGNPNWNTAGEERQKQAEKQMETAKKMTSSLVETYDKQLKSTMEVGKKIQEEFTNQAKHLYELNQQFWADIYNPSKHDVIAENVAKNGVTIDRRKQK